MQQYSITLTNERKRTYTISFFVLAALNCTAFLILAWTATGIPGRNISLAAAGTIAVCIFFYFFQRTVKKNLFVYAAILLSAVFLALLRHYLPALLLLLVFFLFIQAVRTPVVRVDPSSVRLPSFPKRSYAWADLNNMLLKDGLLTIDLKNNKLLQHAIDETKTNVIEAEFNEFCRKCLQESTR